MKKLLILFIISISTFGQSNIDAETAKIVQEGKMLYNSEMASWYGTDIFMELYKDNQNIGGYFSYTDKDVPKCIFFSKDKKPKVIGTISFEAIIKMESAKTDLKVRDFTKHENNLFELRKEAMNLIYSDTIFKSYKNTSFNIIPIIEKDEKKVFVLTGPKINNVVILGNDYLINFDKKNKLINRKQLHKNIIPIQIDNQNEIEATVHSHLPETGHFITSTDICTLMLYGKLYNMKKHFVVSEKYVSIWDCDNDTLNVITKEAFEKMLKEE